MSSFSRPEGVDWELEEQTSLEIKAFRYDHDGAYPKGQPTPVVDFVIIGGIPVDDMLNWCRANNYAGGRDGEIRELEALKATLSKTQES